MLGKILNTAAVVAAPFIDRRLGTVVNGRKGEFVKPCGDVTFGRDITGGGAGAESETENGVLAERHGAGECGDFAIVGDFERDAPLLAEFEEDVLHARLEEIWRNTAKERGDFDAIVHVNAGGAATDRVNPWKVSSGALENFVDLVVMPLRIFFRNWVPDDFLAEDRFTIEDRGDFSIATAEVEADARAIEVTAQGRGGFFGGGDVAGVNDLESLFVNAAAHDFGVELAGRDFTIMRGELSMESVGPIEMDAKAAARPEEEFQVALEVAKISAGGGMLVGKDLCIKTEDGTVRLFESEVDGNSVAAAFNLLTKGAISEGGRAEIGVERGIIWGGTNFKPSFVIGGEEGSPRNAGGAIPNAIKRVGGLIAESGHDHRGAFSCEVDYFIVQDDFAGHLDEFYFAAAESDGADTILVAGVKSGDAAVAVAGASRFGSPLPRDLNGKIFAVEAVSFHSVEVRKDQSEFVGFENGVLAFGALPEHEPEIIPLARWILSFLSRL